ncbi:DUF2459 domain-containing protein [Kaarinaea lacus]
MKATFLIAIVSLCSACASPIKSLYPPNTDETPKSVYLVSHGWHTGIVVKFADIPLHAWPEARDFADAEYLEIGWGDADFYQTPEITLWNKLKAGLWPTPAVLHIVAFDTPVQHIFPQSEIIEIKLSANGYKALCNSIHESYAKDNMGQSITLTTSLYGHGKFYSSKDKYHIFKTCNVWTATALRAAGFPIRPYATITTESLMSKARKNGIVIQNSKMD